MAIVASLDAVAASGALVQVFQAATRDAGENLRLFVKNAGSNALSAAQVRIGPDANHMATLDSTTFASLGAGVTLQLLIPAPASPIRLLVTCASGTTLDILLTNNLPI